MDRLIAGAAGLGLLLAPGQVEQFETYYRELVRWNRRVNLTAIVDYEEVQLKHFLDSLTIAVAVDVSRLRVLDLGTGAGLPGVPLKIIFPSISLVLVDSVHKKTAFLNHLVAGLGLGDVEVVAARAEELARDDGYRERFDLVLSRGVARLATLVELALPFSRVGGSFIAQKKEGIEEEVEEARRAIDVLGGGLREVRGVELEGLDQRALVIIDKISPTPALYPRRSGIPSRRPIKG